ncbi:MAG: electron transfer flavoprotein subunit alpha, partial [Merdibacter sp.]
MHTSPLNAMAMVDGRPDQRRLQDVPDVSAHCPSQAISEQVDAPQPQIDKSQWHDILVYVEHSDGRIHPVTLELIGKAHELARVIGQQVNCLMIGDHIEQAADSLLDYGVANVYLYEDARLQYFRADNYT